MIGFELLVCDAPYRTNVYVHVNERSRTAIVIDAAPGSFAALSKKLKGMEVRVFLTHAHWDHIADAKKFQTELKARLYLHKADVPLVWFLKLQKLIADGEPYEPFLPDEIWEGSEKITFSGCTFQILSLPGHTAGCVGIYDEEHAQLFSGDTLFYQNIGRTDLGGSMMHLKESLQILSRLPAITTVHPGHGLPTTIGNEQALFQHFQKQK